ncbi:MAG: two-component system response regulator [Isosphaeraceae bacterium]|jgi:PAS domain S-box-containing protein|nr:MAG: two-component system response regulator [Isosphaeraceae bacterium]
MRDEGASEEPTLGERPTRVASETGADAQMPEHPRLLVIGREGRSDPSLLAPLADHYELVHAPTMAHALALLRQQTFAGVLVENSQLAAVRNAGLLLQSDEILDAIADGVAVVDVEGRILWCNPEFRRMTGSDQDPVDLRLMRALGHPELLESDGDPLEAAVRTGRSTSALLRVEANRYLQLTVTPVLDSSGKICQLITLTRDVTAEELQRQKLDAIHKAGEELADLTPAELLELSVEERVDLLKLNIVRHMKDLLGLDFIEIRLIDRATGRLVPLVSEGMTPLAANRELYARREGNGVTGFVAVTGKSYLCRDTSSDPLYLEGAPEARSSLTVPLMFHGTVIGTLNVENQLPNAFDERDRQFLEIYGRSVALALNTLELLQTEKSVATSASVEAISRALALPIDDILNDAMIVLDRYAGHDEDILARLRHLISRGQEIRNLVQQVGVSMVPEATQAKPPAPLAGVRLLVVDAEEAIRKAAHSVLGDQGAQVDTAREASEALARARLIPYSIALTDIRLPDMNGYEIYHKLREIRPEMPVILMTGFGYDPTHSIVKARQEGLQTVLYKPFRPDRLIEAVEQTLRRPRTEAETAARPAPERVETVDPRQPDQDTPASIA